MTNKKLSAWQVAMSIMASFFGVQSKKNFHRDIEHGNFLQFFIIGLVLFAVFHLAIYAGVKFILRDVEHQGGRQPIIDEDQNTHLID